MFVTLKFNAISALCAVLKFLKLISLWLTLVNIVGRFYITIELLHGVKLQDAILSTYLGRPFLLEICLNFVCAQKDIRLSHSNAKLPKKYQPV